VTIAVTIDLAGGQLGGAARYRDELYDYLERRDRHDVKVIGAGRQLNPAWLAAREATALRRSRRVALNNVGFLTPGGARWTLIANALHFLTGPEMAELAPPLQAAVSRQARIVHQAARRSDVLVAPCTAMADRIAVALPDVAGRLTTRMHPISAPAAVQAPAPAAVPARARGSLILCPVLFAPYKQMAERIGEWVAAVDDVLDDSVRLIVTASATEVPASLAASPRLHLVGRLSVAQVQDLWHRSRAVFFPTSVESFGYPLAEARVNGVPVIARDVPQNREIAGRALCGYTAGDPDSLLRATEAALSTTVEGDPGPFDPDAYFDWMLGDDR
jgi:Glycosyl transferases group 1